MAASAMLVDPKPMLSPLQTEIPSHFSAMLATFISSTEQRGFVRAPEIAPALLEFIEPYISLVSSRSLSFEPPFLSWISRNNSDRAKFELVFEFRTVLLQ